MTAVGELLVDVAVAEPTTVGLSGAGRDDAGQDSTAARHQGAGQVHGGSSARYRDVFRVREYRGMFAAELGSQLGDQVAAIALAVLLFERSGSPLLAALGYSTICLPWAVGGPVLAALADRLPARRVMVGADLARALLIGLAAIPHLPLPVLGGLVLVAAFLAPPFDAATSALLPEVLEGESYALAVSIRSTMSNSTMLVGFAGGGLLVAAVTPYAALGLDAATFAFSALVLARSLTSRPAALADAEPASLLADALEGWRVVTSDRRRYGPLLLGMVGGAYIVVPEGIATAYAYVLGYGPRAIGLLLASVAAGHIAGSVLVGRFLGRARRKALMWPMALAGTAPLLACALDPGLALTAALFVLAGVGSSFQVAANTEFTAAVPTAARGRAFGLAMTGMFGVQWLAIVAAGAAAQLWAANDVVAAMAAVCALLIVGLRPIVVHRSVASHRAPPARTSAPR